MSGSQKNLNIINYNSGSSFVYCDNPSKYLCYLVTKCILQINSFKIWFEISHLEAANYINTDI